MEIKETHGKKETCARLHIFACAAPEVPCAVIWTMGTPFLPREHPLVDLYHESKWYFGCIPLVTAPGSTSVGFQ